jgi:mevalonate kinase
VQDLWQSNSAHAAAIDEQMSRAVKQISTALQQHTSDSIDLLAKSINMAAQCFKQWGLVSKSLDEHMDKLRQAGAIAVKPTGSGGGGYVVSLWRSPPEKFLLEQMIPV